MQSNNQITADTLNINANVAGANAARVKQNPIANYANKPDATSKSFADLLTDKIEQQSSQSPVNFSKHANLRLLSRDINLTNEQLQRVSDGISKANQKGVRDSLVLVDDIALVVNIRSKTVITAVDKQQNNESVFTNIDGAVIV